MTENTELKKQRAAQDEKMKRLTTKILRLKSDMKKIQGKKMQTFGCQGNNYSSYIVVN